MGFGFLVPDFAANTTQKQTIELLGCGSQVAGGASFCGDIPLFLAPNFKNAQPKKGRFLGWRNIFDAKDRKILHRKILHIIFAITSTDCTVDFGYQSSIQFKKFRTHENFW